MKLKLLLFSLFISISYFSYASQPPVISGFILEGESPIPYASVVVKGSTQGAVANDQGKFELKLLKPGTYTILFQALGYKPIERNVIVNEGDNINLSVALEEDVFGIEQVVVTANRNEERRRDASLVVNMVNPRLLNITSSISMADGLRFQPGLRVENNCQNCGFQQVRINGLEGPYSQILIDSRPIFSSLAGVYGLEQIPVNMIERVEVTRGGGSAIFGSNAIAGVINIITKEPQGNSFSLSYNNMLTGSSPDNNLNLNASVVDDDLGSGLMVYGSVRNRDHFDNNSDGFSEIPLLENTTIGLRGYHKLGSKAKLVATYHHISEFRRGGNKFNLEPQFSDIAEQTAHEIDGGGLSLDYFPTQALKLSVFTSLQHIDRKSYYGAGMNPNAFGNTSNLSISGGTQIAYSMDKLLFSPAQLTGGFEYSHDDLHDVVVGYNRDIKQDANIAGLFLQNEWKTEVWSFLVGGRLDKHNLVDNAIFSPRINFRYNPTEDINFRLTYSEGFRAPQVFDENLHVDIAGGKEIIRTLSENLKEERSSSISGSVDLYHQIGNNKLFNILIEGFYTKLNAPFTEVRRGNEITIENAGSGAMVYGVNLEGRAVLSSKLDLQAGATIQRSLYEEERKWWEPETPEEEALDRVTPTKRMMRTPNSYAYFVATLTPNDKFSASLSGNYTGSMLVPHDAGFGVEGVDKFSPVYITKESPSFFELNTKIAYTIDIYNDTQLELNAGIQNIFNSFQKDFDTGAGRANNYIYGPGMPRTFFVGTKIML